TDGEIPPSDDVVIIPQEHLGWPGAALKRFHIYDEANRNLFSPSYRRGWNKKISEKIHKNRNYRTACPKDFPICHLKTAYASLLKRVQKKDLLYKGKFFSMNSDLALFFPAIEMAGKHARYIRDVLYIYNRETPLNDNKKNLVIHQYTRKIIENLPKYNLLTKLEDDLQSFPEEISTYEEVDSLSSLP
nr:hypothetical protein [Chlamydiota bacterium]